YVVDPRERGARVQEQPAEQRADEMRGAKQAAAGEPEHGAQRVHERLERDRDEDERERQREPHAHLRSGRDPQIVALHDGLTAAPTIRTRILSGSAPITGKRRVMRSDSIKKRPIDTSTMMITSAAMSAVRYPPMKAVPPTISAIGRAISEKLIAAPPIATVSTSAETKNCTREEDESTWNE